MSRFILDLSLTDIDENIENSRGYNPYRDSGGRFASGPGGSSGGGRVGGKKLSEEDLEASMSEAGIERDYVGTRNETLTAIAARNGFNKKPEKVSPEEFENISGSNTSEAFPSETYGTGFAIFIWIPTLSTTGPSCIVLS